MSSAVAPPQTTGEKPQTQPGKQQEMKTQPISTVNTHRGSGLLENKARDRLRKPTMTRTCLLRIGQLLLECRGKHGSPVFPSACPVTTASYLLLHLSAGCADYGRRLWYRRVHARRALRASMILLLFITVSVGGAVASLSYHCASPCTIDA